MQEFKAHFKSVQPDLGGSLPGRLIFGIPGEAGGYYTIQITQPDISTMRLTFLPSKQDMDPIAPVDIILPEGPKGDPGQADEDQVKQFIVEYLTQNPPKVEETDPTVPEWAKKPQKPAYTAAEVGAVSQEDLEHSIDEALEEAKKNGEFDGAAGKTAYEYAKEGGYAGTEAEFAEKLAEEYPTKLSQFQNDSGFITGYTETDPTVPSWAKQPEKPSYSKSEVGLGNVDNVRQYSASNPPPYPVASVNGKTGAVTLGASDVGALPDTYVPPNQTAAQVGADPAGTAESAVSTHNTSTDAHNDLRLELKAINDRLNAFFDSDDKTLDELSEIVAYITSNKALIDSITTSKVSVGDIIDNLTTNVTNKPLSAAQGVTLKALIDAITVPTKVSELTNDSKFITASGAPVQSVAGKTGAVTLAKGDVGLGNVDNVKQYSASNPPPYPVVSVNGQTGEVTLDASAVGARPSTWTPTAANVGAVPTSRTVNGKALSSNITLAASDVGALASASYTTKALGVTYDDGTSETVTLVVAK